MPENQIPEPNS